MPTKSRKRPPPGRVYEAIQQPKQTHFTPRNQAILQKNGSKSTPRTKQQTLTQIDFVLRATPRDEDIDLQYLEEEKPRERKRQKTIHEEPSVSRVQTRSAKRRAIKEEEERDGSKSHSIMHVKQNQTETTKSVSDQVLMPPPKTPRNIRRIEIPSSASPTVTPLSSKSRHDRNSVSRSPLKELSANIRNTRRTPITDANLIAFKPRLEIRDTYDSEKWSSQVSDRTSKITWKSETTSQALGHSDEEHATLSTPRRIETRTSPKYEENLQAHQATQTIKLEIADTDEEGEGEEDAGTQDGNEFGVGVETQFALISSSRSQDLLVTPRCPRSREIAHRMVDNSQPSSLPEASPLEEIIDKATPEEPWALRSSQQPRTESDDSHLRYSWKSQSLREPMFTSRTSQSPSPPPPVDTRQDYAQSNTDLSCLTQPQDEYPSIESDSQFEKGFRNHSPPIVIQDSEDEDEDDEEAKVELDRGQEEEEEELPLDDNSYRKTSLPPLDLPPMIQVPSSQATTVDMTQLPPSSRFLHPNQNMHSMPPFNYSSSPVEEIRSSQIEAAWDGKHLTDSQLLPDSLMNDSLRPVPSLCDEDLEE